MYARTVFVMVPPLMRLFVAPMLLSLLGCATTAATHESGATGPTPVVATYAGRTIRLAEVDAKAADELLKLQEQIYDLRVETAERLALEALVADAAKKDGKSEDVWLNERLERGLSAPTEDELRRLYEQVKGRLPDGVGYDEVKPQLAQALGHEAKANRAGEVFEQLKKEAGFTLALPPPPSPSSSSPTSSARIVPARRRRWTR